MTFTPHHGVGSRQREILTDCTSSFHFYDCYTRILFRYLHWFSVFVEYATVGYMAKRIQMRKNRFQKIAESMKTARENPGPPGVPGDHGDHAPKQTVSVISTNLSRPVRLSFRLECFCCHRHSIRVIMPLATYVD